MPPFLGRDAEEPNLPSISTNTLVGSLSAPVTSFSSSSVQVPNGNTSSTLAPATERFDMGSSLLPNSNPIRNLQTDAEASTQVPDTQPKPLPSYIDPSDQETRKDASSVMVDVIAGPLALGTVQSLTQDVLFAAPQASEMELKDVEIQVCIIICII